MNRETFYDAVRASPFAGKLKATQVKGMEAILDAWDKHGDGTPAKLAYILATAKWETAHTMRPIAEYGKGRGRKYGKADPETGQKYYGRGFVQLTWKFNYQKAKEEIGPDFVRFPDRVMEEKYAAEIIVVGMLDGWFTTKKLSDYMNTSGHDFFHARKIVNGMDKNREIAAIAGHFLKAVEAAESVKEDRPLPDIEKPAKPAPAPSSGRWAWLFNLFPKRNKS